MEELNKILNVTNDQLNSLNMNYLDSYTFWHDISYAKQPAGKEHYRLLVYIGALYNKKILFDIGTYRCVSAAALSSTMTNKIKSYDIIKVLPGNPILPNVFYFIGDVTKDNDLMKSPFIFFDVAHDGIYEKIFYEHLKTIGWKGLLMLDDIKLGDKMIEFWNSITEEKYDISEKGHWSGSGLVFFK